MGLQAARFTLNSYVWHLATARQASERVCLRSRGQGRRPAGRCSRHCQIERFLEAVQRHAGAAHVTGETIAIPARADGTRQRVRPFSLACRPLVKVVSSVSAICQGLTPQGDRRWGWPERRPAQPAPPRNRSHAWPRTRHPATAIMHERFETGDLRRTLTSSDIVQLRAICP